MRAPLLAVALLAAPVPVLAQPVVSLDTYAERPLIDRHTQADVVRLHKDGYDRMTVPVTLSGKGPWRFVVDTGANRTSLSSGVAAALNLDVGKTADIHTVTGVRTVGMVTIPQLELSQSTVRNVHAPLLDSANIGADGILGVDSLQTQRVIFDFEKNQMSVVPAEEKVKPGEEGAIIVRDRLLNGRLIITDADADGNDVTVVLDTGSQVCVGNDAMRSRLAAHRQLTQMGRVQLQSVTGEMLDGEYTFVKRLEIGGVVLKNVAVVFADAHTFGDLGLERRPALLLGMNAMRAFKKVSIDFAHRRMRVVLPEEGSLNRLMMAER